MTKLKSWEIETILDYAIEYIKAIINNSKSEHVEDSLIETKKRNELKNHLMEMFGEEEDG